MIAGGKDTAGGFLFGLQTTICDMFASKINSFCLADWPKSDQSAIDIDKNISTSSES
jgi:hypothetical protein